MRLWYRLWQILLQVSFCAYFNVRIFHRERVPKTGPVLLVCNHQSFLDPPLCGVGLPRELDYIARDSLFRNPAFGWLIRSVNAFPIQRNAADLRAIRSIIDRLQQGRVIVLFPEGTRTRDGRLQPIQSGIELIARKSGATTIPVIVDGAYEVWPRQNPLPIPGPIRVLFGHPIPADEIKGMPRGAYVQEISRRWQLMQDELKFVYQHS